MRLDFFLDTMGAGGAERVASILVNRWASNGHSVRLVTLTDPSSDFYPLDERIERVGLNLVGPARNPLHGAKLNVERLRNIRELLHIDRPDVAVSFITRMNVLVLAAARSLRERPRVIVSERSNPEVHNVRRLINVGRKLLYPTADTVVAQTRSVAEWAANRSLNSSVEVLPNPVQDVTRSDGREPGLIVGAGTLERHKGFDLLVQSVARLHASGRQVHAAIYGDGPERDALQRQITSHGLDGFVELRGRYTDVSSSIGRGDIFVLSSRYEGFPNVLIEAMALGLAPVAFRCRFGPDEIITHESDGLLVQAQSLDELTRSISRLVDDPALRRRFGHTAMQSVKRFSIDAVGERWDKIVSIEPRVG